MWQLRGPEGSFIALEVQRGAATLDVNVLLSRGASFPAQMNASATPARSPGSRAVRNPTEPADQHSAADAAMSRHYNTGCLLFVQIRAGGGTRSSMRLPLRSQAASTEASEDIRTKVVSREVGQAKVASFLDSITRQAPANPDRRAPIRMDQMPSRDSAAVSRSAVQHTSGLSHSCLWHGATRDSDPRHSFLARSGVPTAPENFLQVSLIPDPPHCPDRVISIRLAFTRLSPITRLATFSTGRGGCKAADRAAPAPTFRSRARHFQGT
jgi:hypothetical protein